MTEGITTTPTSREDRFALAFTVGYSGSCVDWVIEEWPTLMATVEGRAEALRRLTDCAEPLNLPAADLVAWVAARRNPPGGGR